jgi:SacI restriction endonuclease
VPIKIDYKAARRTLLQAAAFVDKGQASRRWQEHLRRLSEICESAPKTHIAFIGTALLARATDQRTDVHSLHVKAGTPGAYSARSLAKDVLVPASRELRVHLGVTGREPLNNQPYFHNDLVSRRMNVKGNAKVALNLVCDLLDELSAMNDRSTLLAALAAFIEVRRGYWTTARDYFAPETTFAFADLLVRIDSFVREDSEGGRRAQAVAAGLMDVVEGEENVKTGRINDPDRNFPGDVAAYTRPAQGKERKIIRALEVRDKAISESDLLVFASKAAGFAVARAGILAVAPNQRPLSIVGAQAEAAAEGVNLELFIGWTAFVRQLFFWLRGDAADPVNDAHERIYKRLVELECSSGAQKVWLEWGPRT